VSNGLRIGEGIDRHRLEEGRPLWLGGVQVPSDQGLSGHSDGDALIHAVCDALLGALALGDLGSLFSDEDPANEGRPSADFLKYVMRRVGAAGYRVSNVDATIMAERPRLAPHAEAMRARLAELLSVTSGQVSVKATRGEGLGPEGEGRAITVRAVALLAPRQDAR
jgi:2-C-methyl-D-erythritol 2,4-cyclodiphosphate synthase